MASVATVEGASARADAGPIIARVLLGIAVALVGWWGTYVASQAYGAEAFSLGSKDQSLLLVARVAIGLLAFASAAVLLQWRATALAAAATALLGLTMSAYALVTHDASFLVVVGQDAVPGGGLWSANPLLGVVNDLGNATAGAAVNPVLLLLSATWFGVVIAGRATTQREGSANGVRGWPLPWQPLAGACIVLAAIWLQYVTSEATIAMFVDGRLAPLQPAVMLLIGLVPTYVFIRSPRFRLGAGIAIVLLLVLSVVLPAGSPSGFSSPKAWNFSVGSLFSAILGSARNSGVLVLFGSWIAIWLGAYLRRRCSSVSSG